MQVKLIDFVIGEKPQEKNTIEFVKSLDGADLLLDDNNIIFSKNGNIIFESKLNEFERELFFLTYIGLFQNNEKFRIVQSIGELKKMEEIQGINSSITIASFNPIGYAFKFELI